MKQAAGPDYYDTTLRKQQRHSRLAIAQPAVNLVLGRGPVLELGCGSGVATELLCKAGVAVTALDFSPVALELTWHHAQTGNTLPNVQQYDLRAGLGRFVPNGRNDTHYYNSTLCLQVLEHLENDVALAAEALKVAPFAVFSVPAGDHMNEPAHMRRYGRVSVRRRFGRLGRLEFHDCPREYLLFSLSRPRSH